MARPRVGTIVSKASGLFARVRVDVKNEDGTPMLNAYGKPKSERRWFDLETSDPDLAKRKLAKLVQLLDEGKVEALAKTPAKRRSPPILLSTNQRALFAAIADYDENHTALAAHSVASACLRIFEQDYEYLSAKAAKRSARRH